MSTIKDALIESLTTKEAIIGIVGLGYVGLPLMLRYNQIGYRVLGIDIDQTKVDKLNNGKSYIEHIGTDKIANARKSGFEATTDFSRINQCDAVRRNDPEGRTEIPTVSYTGKLSLRVYRPLKLKVAATLPRSNTYL